MIIKSIISFLFVFSALNVFSQHKCKPGYQCVPGMSTSSLTIKGGCYPDSTAKRIMNTFWKNACEETSIGWWDETLSYSDSHTWNDSLGCISKQKWEVLRDGKWIEITKKQYDSIGRVKTGTWKATNKHNIP